MGFKRPEPGSNFIEMVCVKVSSLQQFRSPSLLLKDEFHAICQTILQASKLTVCIQHAVILKVFAEKFKNLIFLWQPLTRCKRHNDCRIKGAKLRFFMDGEDLTENDDKMTQERLNLLLGCQLLTKVVFHSQAEIAGLLEVSCFSTRDMSNI